jgi:isochorismate synthase
MTTAPGNTDSGRLPAGAAAFLTDALGPQAGDAGTLRVVTVPAPRVDPESLLSAEREGDAFFWATPGRTVHAGLGAARTLTASGAGRFGRIRTDAEALWEKVHATSHPDAPPTVPRVFGGFAFLAGPPSAEWQAFGEATFVLPRLLYSRGDHGATVTVALPADELGSGAARRVLEEVGRFLTPPTPTSNRTAPPAPADDPAGIGGEEEAAPARWAGSVASIQRRIEEGRAEKIVAARSRVVRPPDPRNVPAMLRRLKREAETAARFAFRLGGDVFLGATPERLVDREGRTVRTEALAGSVPADRPEEETRLRESIKEEAEHGYVVRAIAEVLEPLCDRLEYPSGPRVQRLLHVLHLQTPFVGTLRRGVHVLELVERLHPTPAVGGLPTAEALAWIEREEPGSRGWYAAPVGWFDRDGDGEFGVALRSGLIHRDRAHLYAGAGIVRGSDPAAEFHETEIKLRTMLAALGIRP